MRNLGKPMLYRIRGSWHLLKTQNVKGVHLGLGEQIWERLKGRNWNSLLGMYVVQVGGLEDQLYAETSCYTVP